jgi:outer membrane protein
LPQLLLVVLKEDFRMNIRTVGLMVLPLLTAASVCFADLKIGYINSEEILTTSQEIKDAQDKFEKEKARWEQQISDLEKEMIDLQQKLEKQSLLLSSERKKTMEDQLRDKNIKYRELVAKLQNEAVSKNMELSKPIMDKINKIIERIAKEENFDYVLDRRLILWVKPGQYDLTKKVLEELNKGGGTAK